jgi:anti-sigma B factor antagonist
VRTERGPGDLTVTESSADGEVVLSLAGDMDIATAPGIAVRVRDALRRGHRRFRLEMEGVEFIDSTGVAALVHCQRAVLKAGGWMHIECGDDGEVSRMLRLTGIDRFLDA